MAKAAELAHAFLSKHLDPGEQIQAIGLFASGPIGAAILVSKAFFLAVKNYWIGITNKNFIIVHLDASGNPKEDELFKLPHSEVKILGSSLRAQLPYEDKPRDFSLQPGFKFTTGFNNDEFKNALRKIENDEFVVLDAVNEGNLEDTISKAITLPEEENQKPEIDNKPRLYAFFLRAKSQFGEVISLSSTSDWQDKIRADCNVTDAVVVLIEPEEWKPPTLSSNSQEDIRKAWPRIKSAINLYFMDHRIVETTEVQQITSNPSSIIVSPLSGLAVFVFRVAPKRILPTTFLKSKEPVIEQKPRVAIKPGENQNEVITVDEISSKEITAMTIDEKSKYFSDAKKTKEGSIDKTQSEKKDQAINTLGVITFVLSIELLVVSLLDVDFGISFISLFGIFSSISYLRKHGEKGITLLAVFWSLILLILGSLSIINIYQN